MTMVGSAAKTIPNIYGLKTEYSKTKLYFLRLVLFFVNNLNFEKKSVSHLDNEMPPTIFLLYRFIDFFMYFSKESSELFIAFPIL